MLFPGAIQTHNGHSFAGFNAKAHITQHRPGFVVAKPYRTEFQFGLDVAPQRCHGLAPSCNLWVAVRDFENATDAGADALQPRLKINGNADGREQAKDIAVESHESTHGQSAPSYFVASVAKDQPHAKNDH